MVAGLKNRRLKQILQLTEEAFSESRLSRNRKDPVAFFEKEGWEWEEEERDRIWNQIWSESIQRNCQGSSVLDIGSGRGQLLKKLSYSRRVALEPAKGCHQSLKDNGLFLIPHTLMQWKETGAFSQVDHVLCCRSLYAASLHQEEFRLYAALQFMLELANESLEIILRPRRKGRNERDSGLWPVMILAEMGYTPELRWLDSGEEECAWIRVSTGKPDRLK